MEIFRWDRNYETGLEPVDDQHRGLVTLINRFGALIGAGGEPDLAALGQVYGELASYAKHHFEEEQRLMRKVGVDSRHVKLHLREHAAFLTDVVRIRASAPEPTEASARQLLDFLVSWLAYHILGMDQTMARQIAAIREGATPAAAFVAIQIGGDAARSPLLKSLSRLFDIVSERNRQLSELNQSLEAKVVERTKELAAANARLENMAMTDSLTGLFNRRYAMDRLVSELAAAHRHGEPLSLIMMDADGFKAVNDTYGHDAGDAVIRTLGAALKGLFRTNDVVCRMGGDEFLALCPRSSSEAAYLVAERARSAIDSMEAPAGTGVWKGSLSAGVATLGPGLQDAEALLKAADVAVYEAKRQGRNRVVIYG